MYFFEYAREAHLDVDKNGVEGEVKKPTATSVTRIVLDNMNTAKGAKVNVAKTLSFTDITPLFKKLDRLLKSNYRPVSILPTLSKIYEELLYQQVYEYFDSIFSKYLSGFRKGHST